MYDSRLMSLAVTCDQRSATVCRTLFCYSGWS